MVAVTHWMNIELFNNITLDGESFCVVYGQTARKAYNDGSVSIATDPQRRILHVHKFCGDLVFLLMIMKFTRISSVKGLHISE